MGGAWRWPWRGGEQGRAAEGEPGQAAKGAEQGEGGSREEGREKAKPGRCTALTIQRIDAPSATNHCEPVPR